MILIPNIFVNRLLLYAAIILHYCLHSLMKAERVYHATTVKKKKSILLEINVTEEACWITVDYLLSVHCLKCILKLKVKMFHLCDFRCGLLGQTYSVEELCHPHGPISKEIWQHCSCCYFHSRSSCRYLVDSMHSWYAG